METLRLTSPDFEAGGWIPRRFTARGEDRSPSFRLEGIVPGAESLALMLEDASHPIFPDFPHWVIWNLPVTEEIPGGIPAGERVAALDGAVQGAAYGRHRYKGPKPPLRTIHNYRFTAFVLDAPCDLPPSAGKRELLAWMEGHLLQKAELMGEFQSRRAEKISR
ncbi:YbhB/YbcL family Raf kinase inhibitor-like protein [Lawsonibacter faecis]|uniref:YbhB/YbcL family Raf kinase inhibitor-like protein n=1 Tax=Lawsonibacter faecis TaxID=2763052 RepID=A0A8J6JLF6_9FIRM|nr:MULTISPECIES: YbhB/YbcL family Raf kinase inhibitor-like protein [Oscillospiraceae]MTQ97791.1 YbhB/YbcL family Raf kinase inhibitor-like protein [Pseudoflavonifractor sp. BIOML-A16]MTR06778.1 YbhB/YbcL family Raf kinase inhibitor-like protein [Pseudoflavonifractor sp. BIOML-A15]MTR33226.1 YbhB/YbcL family Raf kinase inhibitor-like protein [Pseudoflavonifractor sp. BIOML-A14]MTR74030.1 YbhB/YbcL family Raf kinase inhibitor-like protein [Pseudoflavonifractor sp. BIOML-A18]MTS64800.1 YbhB/YbcL